MKSVYSIFFKSLVSTFYQRHAGLFLVFFILMFGVIPPDFLLSYHKKLMEAFVNDGILRIIVFVCWFLYMLKCIQFALQLLEKKEYDFLFNANALITRQRFSASVITMLWLLVPVLVYGIIAIVFSVKHSLMYSAAEIFIASLILIFISSFIIDYKISHKTDAGLSRWLNYISFRIRKPYVVIVLIQVLNDFKVIFFVTKLLSVICIYIAFAFCDKGVYDLRVLMLGLLFSMLAHITLLFEIRKFEETQLLFMRNTSQTIFKKWIDYILLLTILLLPEMLIMFNAVPQKLLIEQVPVLFLFCISILFAFVGSLYKLPFNKDKSIIYPTYIVMVVFFLILYKVFAVIVGGLFLYGLLLLYRNYCLFEIVEEK